MYPLNDGKRYQELAEKWIDGTITSKEEIEFSEWYNANQDNVVLLSSTFAQNEDVLKKRILKNIQTHKEKGIKKISMQRFSLTRVAAAIVVLLLLTTGSWYYFNKKFKPGLEKLESVTDRFKNDVAPGGDKAVLTLSDGSRIILDNAQKGIVTKQGNTKIVLLNTGQLAYNSSDIQATGEVLFNTIATPKGGQYQIVLPDGSKVWLNASSSLRFPTVFSGSQRNVELTGEGYFEIVKNAAIPFNVQVKSIKVEVLGTHFNVMAYNDESAVKTTLLEGSVKVIKGTAISLLKPGQQVKMDNSAGAIKVSTADVEEAVSWKNGLFQFANEDIKVIMRQIARWYDAEISFEGNMANKNFTGLIARNTNLSKVLKMLELTGEIHFRIEGKNIVVMP